MSKIKINIIANIIGRFWSVISNFIFVPLYIHFLGIESYSIISFTLLLIGLMSVMDVGLTASLTREFSLSTNSKKDKYEILSTLEFCYIFISLFIIVSISLFSDFIAYKWLNLNDLEPGNVSYYLKIISVCIAFQFLSSFYFGGLLGLQKQVKANICQIGWSLFKNALVIFVIMYYSSLSYFFYWQTIITILYTLLLRKILLYQLDVSNKYFQIPKFKKKILLKVGKYALGMLLISLVSAINTQLDRITISKIFPIESLGFYTLAMSIAQSVLFLVTPISNAIQPKITALISEKKEDKVKDIFGKTFVFVSILIISISVNIFFNSESVIYIWTGNWEITKNVSYYLPVLLIGTISIAYQIVPYLLALGHGYTIVNNIIGLSSLFISIPSYYFASKMFGPIGAAYTFSFIQLFIFPIYLYLILKKFLREISSGKIIIMNILIPLIISIFIIKSFGAVFLMSDNRLFELLRLFLFTSLNFSILIIIYFPYKIKNIFFKLTGHR